MLGIQKYVNLLKSIKKRFTFKVEWHVIKKKNILLRHDIDFSLDSAKLIAKKENELKINSTYFFMLSSNMYNVFSDNSQKIIFDIKKLGHKISLHFDPSIYKEKNAGARTEIKTFQNLFKTQLDIISVHRPGNFLKKNNEMLGGCNHTYQDKYFKKIKYISDSGGKDVTNEVSKLILDDEPLQLLIHPLWWTGYHENVTETLDSILKKKSHLLKEEVRFNVKTYKG